MHILSLIIVMAGIVVIFLINSLIMKKNNVKNALLGVDIQLKKRFDLVPNLVAAVARYLEHENDTLTRLTQLRSQYNSAAAIADKVEIDAAGSALLHSLMVQVENYPELKASDSLEQLQRSLNEIEAQLAAARRFYNTAATEFNKAVEVFPSNLVASMLNYRPFELFRVEENERLNPDVGELFKS